ncbi:U1 small nuclear ribonucleoprotein C, putative [Trypanosoma equiperdum]|uniref:Matrin-type domain-containing protein n=2 Tax=Trypanozoon TaxID=39700 RepID=Q38C31_TRYB2|nr:hypothetical protein, conserved [Trypanosoma brucei brucei TREU927]EAN77639.1 hypothetical protein, conserved [Trypanosoma brucei brucei TREU927]SCU67606.1 U1 small nuclear ribonucleoprotein C, putative [Trypanosoma equiperdum]
MSDSFALDDARRIKRRRRLSRMSIEGRRRQLQYRRRHNERDGRLLYCDYCDLFVCSSLRSWGEHVISERHMENMECYYAMVEAYEPSWLGSICDDVSRAHVENHVRRHQSVSGKGSSVPIPAVVAGRVDDQEIIVGGLPKPSRTAAETYNNSCNIAGTPSVRVAGVLVASAAPPVVKVGNKPVTPTPLSVTKRE